MPAKKSRKSTKPDMDSLTDRQHRIIDVIHDAIVLRGYPPSIREIGQAAGLTSTSSVAYQLKELERKGFLRRDPNKPRAVGLKIADPTKPAGSSSLHHADEESTPSASDESADSDIGANHPTPVFIPTIGRIAAGTPILAKETYTSCQLSVNP